MKNIELAKKWVAKAANDILSADNNIISSKVPCDVVCFHCQQAAEKLLKAYLLANDKSYPFSHDLLLLLEKILEFKAGAEFLREHLVILMPYAVEVRYPDAFFEPSKDDAFEARETLEIIMNWLKQECPEMFDYEPLE